MTPGMRRAAALFDAKREAKLRVAAEDEIAPFPARSYNEIHEEEWEWLWEGRFPLAELSYLEGYAGDGKSSVIADIAARLSAGVALPGHDGPAEPCGVLWFTTEESPSKTIKKRLRIAGANFANIRDIDVAKIEDDDTSLAKFKFPSGRRRLSASVKHYAQQMGVPVRLIVIDGVFSVFDDVGGPSGGPRDPNRADDVRAVMGAIRRVAVEHNLCVIAIRHPSKSKGGIAQHRAGGSTAWNDFVRTSWLVGREPGTEHHDFKRVLVNVKGNAGRCFPGLKFHTRWVDEEREVKVCWDDICDLSADEVYAARDQKVAPKATDEHVAAALVELRQMDPKALTMRRAKIACEGLGLPTDAVTQAFQKIKQERRGGYARAPDGEQ